MGNLETETEGGTGSDKDLEHGPLEDEKIRSGDVEKVSFPLPTSLPYSRFHFFPTDKP